MKNTVKEMVELGRGWLSRKRRGGGSLCWTSIDGYASIDLANNGHCFKVCYPRELIDDAESYHFHKNTNEENVSRNSLILEDTEKIHYYAKVKYMFSIHTIPSRWKPLCCILIKWHQEIHSKNLNIPDHSNVYDDITYQKSHDESIEMIRIILEEDQQEVMEYSYRKRLEDILLNKDMLQDSFLLASVHDQECVFRFVSTKESVELIFLTDYSFAMSHSDATEFHHYISNENLDQPIRYSIENAPETQYSSLYEKRYNVASMFKKAKEFLEEALRMYQRFKVHQITTFRHSSSKVQQQQQHDHHQLSNYIRESLMIPDWGEFTAFKDGSVRVRFIDRTHIELSKNLSCCKLMLMDGTFHELDLNDSFDNELHVHVALKFARWAFATSEERQQWILEDLKFKKDFEDTRYHNRQFLLDISTQSYLMDDDETLSNSRTAAAVPQIMMKLQERNSKFLQEIRDILNPMSSSSSTTHHQHTLPF